MHGGNLAWAAALAGCSPSAILDFSASINPLGPPESALAAIQAHLKDLRAYPDPDYQHLRAILSEVHQIPPEWILPGNGSAELLTWAGWDLAELEATYLLTPAFGDYLRALEAFKAKVVRIRLEHGEWNQNLPIPYSLFPIPYSHVGLLLNNPHNPTGSLFLLETIMPALEQFALVVVDEAFMDFLPPDRQQSLIPLVQKYPNLAILRSLTKFYSLPGLRLGYAIAHPDRLQRWQKRRDPWPVNILAVAAAEAAIGDVNFQQQTWRWLEIARNQLFEGLTDLSGLHPYPSAANFLLVQSDRPSSQIQQRLLASSQILIRDCLSFPELGDRFFRVAVRDITDNQRLIEGLKFVLDNW